MGVLADHQIAERVRWSREVGTLKPGCPADLEKMVIEPFVSESPKGCISFGLSSYGYDVRVGYRFKVFTPVNCGVIDPKNFDPKSLVDVDLYPSHKWEHAIIDRKVTVACRLCKKERSEDGSDSQDKCSGVTNLPDYVLIPPNSFALAETVETVELPRDVLGILLDKSTYRRCGIVVSATVIEPEWRGKITIEISNTAPLPARIYCNQGIALLIFLKADRNCRVSYQDKRGRYQDQQGIVLPFVE